ncbi:MAG TPA: TIGR04222 domain-containing membrane protein [Catenuloplanes sp.]|jgi:uncharacterized protein (TIGR04222 family)
MIPPPPAGDTWGVPGPAFLIGYLLLAAAVVLLSVLARRRLFAGRGAPAHHQLHPQQAAHLHGGARLALYTSLGGLRAANVIGTGPDGALTPTGQLWAGVTPLDTAVFNAAGRRLRARSLSADTWVVNALTELRTGLESAGLAVSPAVRRAARRWSLLLAGVAALGLLRMAAGADNDKPVGYLIPIVAVLALVAVAQYFRVPAATRAGTAAVAALRRENHYLSPTQSPSYATYGAGSLAMGVALFGTASLYAADPAFATEAEVQRNYANDASGSAAGGGGSGGDSSGGGSSCGSGGGCGGGCGG